MPTSLINQILLKHYIQRRASLASLDKVENDMIDVYNHLIQTRDAIRSILK